MEALRRWFVEHGHTASDASSLALASVQELVARAATSAAYSETFVIMALLFVISIPCVLLYQMVPREESA